MAKTVFGKTSSNATTSSTGTGVPNLVGGKPPSLFTQINNIVEDSKGKVSAWRDKQEKYYRMRMRVKKPKKYPFKDSSNLRMPTADINIKKVKSAIMKQVFGTSPIVQAVPTPSGNMDQADNISKFMDHLVNDIIDIKNKAEIGIDQSLEKGFYLAKVYWRLEIIDREEVINVNELPPQEVEAIMTLPDEQILPLIIERLSVDIDENVADDNIGKLTEQLNKIRNGETKVKFKLRDVIYNYPDVDFISPDKVYVPTDTGYDPQKATSITFEFYLPLDIIKKNGSFKNWDMEVINSIESLSSIEDEQSDLDKDMREGIDRMNNPSGLVKIWETFGLLDIDNSGSKEFSQVTTFPDFSSVVRKVKLTNFTHTYPIVKFFYELTDDRWFAHRGIPEALEDMIKEIDVQHNMKIDGQTMRNAPMIVYRAGMVNPRTAKANPAAAIPVQGLQSLDDTIKAINLHNPNAEFSYEREQMLLETKIQEYVGQVDFGLQSTINRRQPRTLGEVELQQNNAGSMFSLDAGHYTDSFSKLFQMIFELWSEFGPDNYEFNYFGQSATPTKIKLSKEELQGKYNIKVRGNDQNTNPQVQIQKANQIILAATNETLIQMGVVGPSQAAEGLKRMYQAMGVENWEALVNQQPQQPPPPDPRMEIKPNFDELTDREQAQILNAYQVEADAPGRQHKQKVKSTEVAAKIANLVGEEPKSGREGAKQPAELG